MRIRTIFFLLFILFFKINFSQDTTSEPSKKFISVGISSAISDPFFLNAMPELGYKVYNSNKNLGFRITSSLLVRINVDYFIVSTNHVGVFKKIKFKEKISFDAGLSAGAGINSSPKGVFLLSSCFVSFPIKRISLECQPTFVVPDISSSYIQLNARYNFYLKKKTK